MMDFFIARLQFLASHCRLTTVCLMRHLGVVVLVFVASVGRRTWVVAGSVIALLCAFVLLSVLAFLLRSKRCENFALNYHMFACLLIN